MWVRGSRWVLEAWSLRLRRVKGLACISQTTHRHTHTKLTEVFRALLDPAHLWAPRAHRRP